jgi:hypothetical protein
LPGAPVGAETPDCGSVHNDVPVSTTPLRFWPLSSVVTVVLGVKTVVMIPELM